MKRALQIIVVLAVLVACIVAPRLLVDLFIWLGVLRLKT